MNAIELRHVTKRYPAFTLDDLSLTLPSGCILGLVGENGAGKSTAIRILLDTIRRDSGEVTVLGRPSAQQCMEEIGVVLDTPGFPATLTPRQMGRIMADLYPNWDGAAYAGLLRRLQLPESKQFRTFSRGMQMKLSIAVALSHRARLLVLDEPTSGLDPVVRSELLDIFYDFTRDEDHSILISSHITSDLERLCDYIAFLHQGKLLLCEEKDRLRTEFGRVQCDPARLRELDARAIIGRRETVWGAEAIVRRSAIPANWQVGPVEIEDLFVFLVKGAA